MLTFIRDYFRAKCPEFVKSENFVFGADEKTLKERIGSFGDFNRPADGPPATLAPFGEIGRAHV